jgi:MFS family permease
MEARAASDMRPSAAQRDSLPGWKVAGAAFVGLLLSVGTLIVYSFGVLSSAMAADFGWSGLQRGTLFIAFALCSAVAGPVWGAIADRVGPRKVVLVSSVLMMLGFTGLATIPNDLLIAHLVFAAIGLFGSGTLPPVYASVVVGWFNRRRGLALGVTILGVGVGAAALPALAAKIISLHGWRELCLAYGLMILFISLPVAVFFLRAFPEERAHREAANHSIRPKVLEASRKYYTWVLAGFAFITGAILVGSIANFVPLLQSRGLTLLEAASYQSFLGISMIAGRVLGGASLDRIFAPRVMTAVLLFTAAGFAILQAADAPAAYIVAAIGIGLAIGTEIDFLGFIVSRYYDRAVFTTLFALQFAAYSLGASVGPALVAWMVESSGGYGLVLVTFASASCGLALLMFVLPRYAVQK